MIMAGEVGQTFGKQSISLCYSEKGTYDANRWKHRKGAIQGEEAQCNGEGDQAHHDQLVVGCKDGGNAKCF
jgi:hypothetical protein